MNKIGLKLWNINTDFYYEEAKKLFEQNIFDYIELYVVPDNLDKLDKWAKLNIPFDIHAPHFAHGFNLSKKEFKEINKKYYQEVKTYADTLNSKVIVFHGGTDGNYKETAEQLASFNESRALIENKPYKTMPFIEGVHYVGSIYEEIGYIIKNTNCGFCFDICHAATSAISHNFDIYESIKKWIKLDPTRIHLSDLVTPSELDFHKNYGEGNLDFKKLFNILPIHANITVETPKKSKTDLNDFKADVAYLKNILKMTKDK